MCGCVREKAGTPCAQCHLPQGAPHGSQGRARRGLRDWMAARNLTVISRATGAACSPGRTAPSALTGSATAPSACCDVRAVWPSSACGGGSRLPARCSGTSLTGVLQIRSARIWLVFYVGPCVAFRWHILFHTS